MRKWTLVALAFVTLAAPATSRAQFSFGLRTGYAKPVGEIKLGTTTVDQSSFITKMIPVQADIDYRIAFGLSAGMYASYGFGQPDKSSTGAAGCTEAGVTCQRSTVYRAGVQAAWAMPFPLVKPWVGAGIGYEWAKTTREGAKNVGARGPEMLNLQFGVDVALPFIRVGPFVTWTTGAYKRESISTGGDAVDVNDPAKHGWVYYGLRVRLDP
jgi:hypothetical protein